ncbi:MAG TPA: hypothetical protein VFQ76_10120 [Longimicrobiaceae bacterium]|nr:hypothetical protein [Longimicrobiaceae bacterium]
MLGFSALLLIGSAMFTAARAKWDRDQERNSLVPDASYLLGRRLPAVSLRDPKGNPVLVSSRLAPGRPSIVFIASPKDYMSCANFPLELRILRNQVPSIQGIFIGSGSDSLFFRRFIRDRRIADVSLLDPAGQVLRQLRVPPDAPLVLLLDKEGTVIFADTRTGGESSRFPISRSLLLLRDELAGAQGQESIAGESRIARARAPEPQPSYNGDK